MSSNHAHGISVSYSYDGLNRLSTVVDNLYSGENTTTYTYDPANNVGHGHLSQRVAVHFNYDSLNRLTAMASPGLGIHLSVAGRRATAPTPTS